MNFRFRAPRLLRSIIAAAAVLVPLVSSPPPTVAQATESVASGSVRVVHAARQRGLARQVLRAATTPVRFPGLGLVSAPESTTIVLAPDARTFAEATGGGVPEWAGGVAIPDLRRIVLPQYPGARVRDDAQGTVLRHEIAHLVLRDRLPGTIPRWFNEGYAEVASGGWDVESAWQLRWAFVTGATPPLDSLELSWPRGEVDARMAYLLSATAVDYLRRLGGEEGMELFFSNWRQEGDFESALRTTYGITLGHLEDGWRADVRSRYGWLAMLSNVALLWLIATALVMAAWIPRRRRNRQRLAQMDAEERMLPPPRPEMAGVEYPLPEPQD